LAAKPPITRARRLLFLCHLNRRRSATAERIFCKRPDVEVRSAGLSADALVQVNARMLDWADVVFTMEPGHLDTLSAMFPGHAALERVACLDIPDTYAFLDPELVGLLEERVLPVLLRVGGVGSGDGDRE
jgi:predicted protein tyrosine phosphatase